MFILNFGIDFLKYCIKILFILISEVWGHPWVPSLPPLAALVSSLEGVPSLICSGPTLCPLGLSGFTRQSQLSRGKGACREQRVSPPSIRAPWTQLVMCALVLQDTGCFAFYSPSLSPQDALTVGKVMLMMLNRLCSLGEMTVRPPPGGPMAAIRNMS